MSIITTIKASCKDCYKCVRHCPVKAIRVIDGHAEIMEDHCLEDGRCVSICPQQAKKVKSSLDLFRLFRQTQIPICASLAPSHVAEFGLDNPRRLSTTLRKLGFTYVEETAEGAEWVAREHLRLLPKGKTPLIASSCPAIVNLLEIYYPHLLPYLASVVSPMVAHGRIQKKRYGAETKVVFIGPCIAKKGEGSREGRAAIDAVLTFVELRQLMEEAGVDPATEPPSEFDGPGAVSAYAFATPGGLIRSAALDTDLLAAEVVTLDGLEESLALLNDFDEVKGRLRLIELLACRGGCVMGPGTTKEAALFTRRNRVINYAEERLRENGLNKEEFGERTPVIKEGSIRPQLWRRYQPRGGWKETPAEEEIERILAKTGKFSPKDELNCGACGYNSCREKAIAVARGVAEIDMCIPFMRAKAESRANLIIQMTPNAIFVVDKDLKIVEVNPAAERRFYCKKEEVLGADLQMIMDPRYFRQALESRELITAEVSYPEYAIETWQAIFYAEKEDLLIGIFADITREKKQRERLAMVTGETLEKAQEVIDKQMRVAQEIAGLLGETTAETKVLLTRLIKLFQNEDGKIS